MPETTGQERTELATPRKRQKAREKGNVARSVEIASVIVFVAGLLGLKFLGGSIFSGLGGLLQRHFTDLAHITVDSTTIIPFTSRLMSTAAAAVLPIALLIAVAGTMAHVLQVGVLVTLEPLLPRFDRISPLSGFKKLFSKRSAVELIKNLIKLAIVGALVAWTLVRNPDDFFSLMLVDVAASHQVVFMAMFRMAVAAAAALALLAILDFFFQRYDYEKQLMMTKQEIKEEHKETEGDPHLKGHLRALQREASRKRMMESVKTADVVVTNPVHFAVALKYDPATMKSPKVVAKGARKLAKRLRELAQAAGVPIVEDPPLARALYKACEVGAEVPVTFFKAVAELLAFVYRQRDARLTGGAR